MKTEQEIKDIIVALRFFIDEKKQSKNIMDKLYVLMYEQEIIHLEWILS